MIPRVAASGEAIYRGRVPSETIEQRLETCWRPYHTALSLLVERTYSTFGGALLIDAHSMPSSASNIGSRDRDSRVDIVLGDNHGESCAPELVAFAETWFRARGLRVLRNQPYAGGFTTQCYGRPSLSASRATDRDQSRAIHGRSAPRATAHDRCVHQTDHRVSAGSGQPGA